MSRSIKKGPFIQPVLLGRVKAMNVSGEKKVIAFNLSGHGHFDMTAYQSYHHGLLEDFEYPDHAVAEAMTHLPEVP